MTHAELIDDLVAANHILAHRRIFDAYGHISARDPRNPERYWLTRSMPPADVTADDIIEFDLDNKHCALARTGCSSSGSSTAKSTRRGRA